MSPAPKLGDESQTSLTNSAVTANNTINNNSSTNTSLMYQTCVGRPLSSLRS